MKVEQGGQLKKTIKHSAIYAVGTILRRITGFVMLPIYTAYLTPADYGVVQLLSVAIELMGILVGLRITSALLRYYMLAKTEHDKNEVVSTILMTVIFMSGIGVYILHLNSEWLMLLILGNSEYVFEFKLFVYTLLTNAVATTCLSYIRARQKPVLFVSIGAVTLVLQVFLNIIFIVYNELHVLGVVYSALISGALIATVLSAYVLINVGFKYSTTFLYRLFKFIAPLMFAAFGAFYVAYVDKYFIRVFSGLGDVGLYALAAKVSGVLMTFFEAFNMSWAADRYEVYKKENAKVIYDQVFRGVGAVLILVGAGLSMFAGDLFRVMTQPAFYPATYIVPLLVIVVLVASAFMFCSFGVFLKERTRHVAEASWLKVIIATIGYVILIPYFGVFGAAFTLAFATLIQLYWIYKKSILYYDMELNWKPISMMLMLSFACVILGLVIPQGEVLYFIIRVFVYLGLILGFYFLPIWSHDERKMAKSIILSIVKRKNIEFG
jgi:O-antigen/teichoic acid export membrane protein